MTMNDIIHWAGDHSWLIEALLATLATVIALYVWAKVRGYLHRRIHSNNTPWDDILLKALSLPIVLLIIIVGMQQIGASIVLVLPEQLINVRQFLTRSGDIAVIGVIFWTTLRLVSGIESEYRRKTITVGEKEIDPGTIHSIFRVLRGVIFIVAVLTIMNGIGISVSGILAFGGIGGVLIGFAAKDTLANFFSGMLIFWERPFVIGDWIRRPDANIEGVVEHIGWRMTQIRTFDHRPLYVPNSLFFNSIIENPQRMTNRRIYEYMGLRYEDIDKLPAVLADIREMLRTHPDIAQNQIQMVYFDRYGASSLDFFLYAMTNTIDWKIYHGVKEDVLLKVAGIVAQRDCEFAFPTRTLHHIGEPTVGANSD